MHVQALELLHGLGRIRNALGRGVLERLLHGELHALDQRRENSERLLSGHVLRDLHSLRRGEHAGSTQ